MNSRTFHEQLYDMWRTRPVRLPAQGHIAGVAAGIGVRYGVDPVLIRVAFVVSTIFGGAGIVLYLACWLLLSRAGDETSPAESLFGRGRSSDSGTKTVVLLVALAIAMSAFGPVGVGSGGSGFISMVLMLGGLWLLYQRQPVPPPLPTTGYPNAGYPNAGYPAPGYPGADFSGRPFTGAPNPGTDPQSTYSDPYANQQYGPYTRLPDAYVPGPPPVSARSEGPATKVEGAGTESDPESDPAHPAGGSGSTDHSTTISADRPEAVIGQPVPTPPLWDPLGVAPFAWDLPEPAPAAPLAQPGRRHSRITTTVLGLAVMAAAVAGAVAVGLDSQWLTPARIGAIALVVIGLGLLIGAFLHRGHGLLVVTGPLIGFVVLASIVGPIDTSDWGNREWTPLSTADIRSEYSGRMGNLSLDLRRVDLTENKTVDVNGRFGNIEVIVPPNMNVRNDCSIRFGEAHCLPEGLDGGRDGTAGPVLTLNVTNEFGNVEVRRG